MFTPAHYRYQLEKMPQLTIAADRLRILHSAAEFKQRILQLIATAQRRIYLVALYLQDDEAGREILHALYAAKAARPELDIKVFVDFHRAQRGLIGKGKQSGNHLLYQALAAEQPDAVQIYGVPVKRREWLGVLHLKGFLFDDTLLYSGASLNNIYLHQQGRYRFDRYHELEDAELARSWAQFIVRYFGRADAVQRLDQAPVPTIKALRPALRRLKVSLEQASYEVPNQQPGDGEIGVTPLVGLGKRRNRLNRAIRNLLRGAERDVFICTPYFNPPKDVARDLAKLLRRGVRLTLVIGDKTANDFFIPEDEPFKIIGALPYLYEINLRRFLSRLQYYVNTDQLVVRLWKDDDNTYHLKGMWVDDKWMLLTGNNLNPRAWRLDLENAILIHDPKQELTPQRDKELELIRTHTTVVKHYRDLQSIADYPVKVRKLIRRLRRIRIDRLISRIL